LVQAAAQWEIDHMLVRDMLPGAIFIAQEQHEEHGRQALGRILGDAPVPPVFLYSAAGEFKEPAAFKTALAARLSSPREPQHQSVLPRVAEIARPQATPEAGTTAAGSRMSGRRFAAAGAVVAFVAAGAFGWFMLRGEQSEPPTAHLPPATVSLMVQAASVFVFSGPRGGPISWPSNTAPPGITLKASSGNDDEFSWSVVAPPWIKVEPDHGVLAGGWIKTVDIRSSDFADSLPPGTYEGRVVFQVHNGSTDSDASRSVDVYLNVREK
jgi:hypothetical protein